MVSIVITGWMPKDSTYNVRKQKLTTGAKVILNTNEFNCQRDCENQDQARYPQADKPMGN